MKILLVGAGKPPAIERYFLQHLNELGAEASLLAIQNIFFDYYEKNIFHKVLFKTGLSAIYKKINDLFRSEVENKKPDLIWVFKGMELFPESLQWVRDRKIKLVNYNTDNPFIFSGRGSGNSNVFESIRLYDLHFTYDHHVKERITREYGIRCAMLPFGFEDRADLYAICTAQEEQVRLCFVGSPDKDRTLFLETLADQVPMDVYGPLWNKFLTNQNIIVRDEIHGDEFWKVLNRYRIQLNIMRPHNPDTHNMRSFEVPGIGGIMLAPDTADHREYFRANEEVFLYSNATDCMTQIRTLLNLSKETSMQIRKRARERSVSSGYSYFERAKTALMNFEQL